jgi:hypothetical protein
MMQALARAGSIGFLAANGLFIFSAPCVSWLNRSVSATAPSELPRPHKNSRRVENIVFDPF